MELKFIVLLLEKMEKFLLVKTILADQDMLKTQLLLKGVVTPDDWEEWKEHVIYDFNEDNHFFELKDSELFVNRINSLQTVTEYIGTYFSKEWIRKNVLHQTDDEIEEIDKQIADEKDSGEVDPMAGDHMGGPDGGFGSPEYDEYDDEDETPTPKPNGNGQNGAQRPAES